MRLINAEQIPYDDKGNTNRFAVGLVPTVEAAPLVHGKWVEVNPDICKCSVCGEYSCARKYYDKQEDIKTEFCPDCGAKME